MSQSGHWVQHPERLGAQVKLPTVSWLQHIIIPKKHTEVTMDTQEAVRVLSERRDYLGFRIEAKTKCGWSTEYDCREYEALTWLLERQKGVKTNGQIEGAE